MQIQVTSTSRLTPEEAAEVSALVERATTADGVAPLSEHVLLHLAHGSDPQARNFLLRADSTLAGYAHLDTTDPVSGPSAELVVDPALRRRGLAGVLLAELFEATEGRLRLWAHGQHPGAVALAHRHGFYRSRALWQMRRSLYAPLPAPRYPDGVQVRTFRVGQDEQAWVAVNRRAFVALPDQGGWGVEDLRLREREPWFDPAGFFLAQRDERLLGFHWTKVHGAGGAVHPHAHPHGHPHEPLGEVYVVGVDPDAQGLGLGTALTLTGLAYLRSLGLGSAMLYVDEDNATAIAVYRRLGFTHWDTDVTFQRGVPTGAAAEGAGAAGGAGAAEGPAGASGAPEGSVGS